MSHGYSLERSLVHRTVRLCRYGQAADMPVADMAAADMTSAGKVAADTLAADVYPDCNVHGWRRRQSSRCPACICEYLEEPR